MSRHIESQQVSINCPAEKVFNFLGDFKNFGHLLPEEVINWKTDGETCSFEVKGLATLGLRMIEKIPFSSIIMKGEGNIPFQFSLKTSILDKGHDQCAVRLFIDSEMSGIIAMMAEKPLVNFVDILVDKLKFEMEK